MKKSLMSMVAGALACGAGALACGGSTGTDGNENSSGSESTVGGAHGTSSVAAAHDIPSDPVGRVDRETVLAEPGWAAAFADAAPDDDAARALAEVPAGAEVEIYLGTWCPDSRREVGRFFKALDVAGDPMPFSWSLIAVDRRKQAPGGLLGGVDLRYVPTFVVRRDGEEVGRIVESAPSGIEEELARLLTGEAQGVVSARTDL